MTTTVKVSWAELEARKPRCLNGSCGDHPNGAHGPPPLGNPPPDLIPPGVSGAPYGGIPGNAPIPDISAEVSGLPISYADMGPAWVDPGTGSLHFQLGYRRSAAMVPLPMLYYNSRFDPYSSLGDESPTGTGWGTSFHQSVEENDSGDDTHVTRYSADGRWEGYHHKSLSTGLYQPPGGTRQDLARTGGGWRSKNYADDSVTAFDSVGRMTSLSRGGATWTVTYDGGGLVKTAVSPRGLRTSYVYDSGQLRRIVEPGGRIATLAHLGANNLRSYTNPAGETLICSYGADGTLSRVQYPEGNAYDYRYDSRQRVIACIAPSGARTSLTYLDDYTTVKTDPCERLTTYTFGTR
ncbi:MAG: hypothetical protein AB7O38_28315, partial [Pirellulaceae bacterium]